MSGSVREEDGRAVLDGMEVGSQVVLSCGGAVHRAGVEATDFSMVLGVNDGFVVKFVWFVRGSTSVMSLAAMATDVRSKGRSDSRMATRRVASYPVKWG